MCNRGVNEGPSRSEAERSCWAERGFTADVLISTPFAPDEPNGGAAGRGGARGRGEVASVACDGESDPMGRGARVFWSPWDGVSVGRTVPRAEGSVACQQKV